MSPEKVKTSKEIVSFKNEDTVRRYLVQFLNQLTITENGEVTHQNIIQWEIFGKIFSNQILIKGIDSGDLVKAFAYRAVTRLKKFSRQDLDHFRFLLAGEYRRYTRLPSKKYRILIPLHVVPGQFDRFRRFIVDGIVFFPKTWTSIQRDYDTDRFFNDARLQIRELDDFLFPRFTPFIVELEAKDTREAIDIAEPAFDMFRSLLNLNFQFGILRRRWGGYPTPLSDIYPPPIYGVFDSSNRFVELYFNLKKYEHYGRNQVNIAQIKRTRVLLKQLCSPAPNNSTSRILRQAIEKYGTVSFAQEILARNPSRITTDYSPTALG